jgi:MFS family permease
LGRHYPREAYAFIGASLVNSIGSALLWPLTTIYVFNVLHRSYGEAGFVLFCQAAAGVFGQFLGGALFHRVGPKRLIVGSLVFTACAQFGLIFAKEWVLYIFVMTINGFLNSITMPAISAFVGYRWREQRYRLFNGIYVVNNIGVAVGTSLAGILAAISFNFTFFFDGLTTLGFAVFFYVFLRKIDLNRTAELDVRLPMQSDQPSLWSLLRPIQLYLFLGLGSAIVYFATSAWNTGVAPFINQSGMSPVNYSFLWTVNGIVILIGQPVTVLLNRSITKNLTTRLVASALFYAVGFLYMFITHGKYVDLVIGMIIATFGEMLAAPTIPSLITENTDQSAPFYLGLVGGAGSVGRLVGPPVYGNLFDAVGVMPILLCSAICYFVATGLFTLHGWLNRTHQSPQGMQVTGRM